jgi:hypothetical protein
VAWHKVIFMNNILAGKENLNEDNAVDIDGINTGL